VSEETNPEQEPDPGPLRFAVKVEVYGLSRYAVLHHDWCYCTKRNSTMRTWRNFKVQDIHELLAKLWPGGALDPWEPRVLIQRVAMAACHPALPIPPEYRTLMREENTLTEMAVTVCPDATGKQIVHDSHCQHAARLRAVKQRTGRTVVVSSVRALVPVVFPEQTAGGSEDQLAAIAESEFEVRPCTPLPLNEPVPVSWETKLAVARQRAYAALLSLSQTALTSDRRATRDLHTMLGRRLETGAEDRVQPMAIPDDVREYVASAQAAMRWRVVRSRTEAMAGTDTTDADRALAWVVAAQSEMKHVAKGLTMADSDGGTAMGVAWERAQRTGDQRFVRDCEDALHEVNVVERQVRG
jgi:hypothetical protein